MQGRKFLRGLVSACPGLPYAATGLWMAWMRIAYDGVVWISAVDSAADIVDDMYVVSTAALALGLISLGLLSHRVSRLMERPSFILASGALSTLGCFVVILVGPLFFQDALTRMGLLIPVYYGGCVLAGLGLAPIVIDCSRMFGHLLPRNAILRLAWAGVVMVGVYFVAIGFPQWRIFGEGPQVLGTVAFVLLPLGSAICASLYRFVRIQGEQRMPSLSVRGLPASFWKLAIAVSELAFSAGVLQGYGSVYIFDSSGVLRASFIVLFQLFVVGAFAVIAVGADENEPNFVRLFTTIMVAAGFFIALAPVVGVSISAFFHAVPFCMRIFEFVLLCLLAFIVYQRCVSALIVAGIAYGMYAAASCLGYAVGAYGMPSLQGGMTAVYVFFIISFVTLAAAFLVFTEKQFKQLYEGVENDSAPLSSLMKKRIDARTDIETHRGKFNIAMDFIADEHHLSRREKEVLRHLAMGHDSMRIAEDEHISWNTVRTHTRNLYRKLDVHSKRELTELIEKYLDS
ncbi:LuxR family transcriptional regulator [Slackia exigua]|uniref:LuxR family transcriptional regulator n=1 Tax=Slackia exigua TaxID=84109 RepID=UPI003B9F111C